MHRAVFSTFVVMLKQPNNSTIYSAQIFTDFNNLQNHYWPSTAGTDLRERYIIVISNLANFKNIAYIRIHFMLSNDGTIFSLILANIFTFVT